MLKCCLSLKIIIQLGNFLSINAIADKEAYIGFLRLYYSYKCLEFNYHQLLSEDFVSNKAFLLVDVNAA